jgi:hypothetical protein
MIDDWRRCGSVQSLGSTHPQMIVRTKTEMLQAGNAVSDVAFSATGDLWLTGIASNGARFARLSRTRWDLIDGADPPAWAGPAQEALTIAGDRVWAVGSILPTPADQAKTYAERSPVIE